MARRILQTVLTLHTGGLERIVIDLVNHSSRDFEHWVCCIEERGDMSNALSHRGIPVLELGKRPGIRLEMIPRIADIVRDNGIDLLHTHNSAPAFYGGLAGRLSGLPVVHTKHGLNLFGQHLLNRVSYWFTDTVVAVSESAGALARSEGVPFGRLRVVDNGVDVERFSFDPGVRAGGRVTLGLPGDAFVIGSLGRLSPEKNHALLIEAFHDLARDPRAARAVLLLAGDGPSRAGLEQLAASLGVGDKVRFLGMVRTPETFYPMLDVFVMPSRSEGLPVALLEAMSCSLPVLVTRVGAMPGVAAESGIVVESGDRPGMATKLLDLMQRTEERTRLGVKGRERVVADYSVATMVATYESLYHKLLDG